MLRLRAPSAENDGRQKECEVAEAPGRYSQFDILLPSQHFGALRKVSPEQRLMIAVLNDVLDCLEKYRLSVDAEGRRLFDEARQWLLAKEADWPYSFQCICSALDLDSGAVLRNLRVEPDRNTQARRVS
jgi:hypothetical protein